MPYAEIHHVSAVTLLIKKHAPPHYFHPQRQQLVPPLHAMQAHATNPQADIYLIGDNSTRHFPKWIKHVDATKYNGATQILHTVYRHKSNLGPEFELTCIERWFVLYAFMVEQQMTQCVYLDSDILVYENLAEAYQKLPPHHMTWCRFSAHSNFVNNRDALKRYCDNVIDLYTDRFPTALKPQSLFHQVMSGQVDMNISDMTFFHDYNLRYPNSLLVVSDPNPDGTFDISMEDTRVFEDNGQGFKRIIWQNNIPFGQVKATGEWVPFVTLHFQGKGKILLKSHIKHNPFALIIIKTLNDVFLMHSKIKRKLSK